MDNKSEVLKAPRFLVSSGLQLKLNLMKISGCA